MPPCTVNFALQLLGETISSPGSKPALPRRGKALHRGSSMQPEQEWSCQQAPPRVCIGIKITPSATGIHVSSQENSHLYGYVHFWESQHDWQVKKILDLIDFLGLGMNQWLSFMLCWKFRAWAVEEGCQQSGIGASVVVPSKTLAVLCTGPGKSSG